MTVDFPLHRFEEFGKLNDAELRALHALGNEPRHYRRHAKIRTEDVVSTGFYVLVEGWVAASHMVASGGRQILKVHLPGDAVGTPSMSTARTVEELTALTQATMIEVPFARFGQLFEDHPRVAARFMLSIQWERVALMDRLASIGRTSAPAQLAAFLLDLMERLTLLGLVENDGFVMRLTQEQIGDALGLTAVHVNRTLRVIEDEGLIAREERRITLLDRPALERLAERPKRVPLADPAWLPPAR